MNTVTANGQTEKKHITKVMRLFWGAGEFGESIGTTTSQVYGTWFLTNIVLVSPAIFALTTMIVNIANIFLTPISGVIIDGLKPMKWGKLRSYILVFPFIYLLLSPFAFLNFGNPTATAFIIRGVALLNGVVYAVMVTANVSLIPSMCAYTEEANSLTSNRMIYASLGRMAGGPIVPIIVTGALMSMGNSAYLFSHILCVIFLILTYMFIFWLSKGYEGNGAASVKMSQERLTIKEMVRAVVVTPEIIPLIIADVTSTLGAFLLPALTIYMFQYVIEDGTRMDMLPLYQLVVGIVGTAGAYFSRWCLKVFPDKRHVLYITYLPIAAFVFMTRFFTGNVNIFIGVVGLLTFFMWITQPIETAMYYDLALIAEERMGKNPIGTFLALSQYAPRLAGLINGVVMSTLFVTLKFDPAKPITDALRAGFTDAFSIVNCVIPIVGWLGMFFFYKITPARVAEARQAIAQRSAANAE